MAAIAPAPLTAIMPTPLAPLPLIDNIKIVPPAAAAAEGRPVVGGADDDAAKLTPAAIPIASPQGGDVPLPLGRRQPAAAAAGAGGGRFPMFYDHSEPEPEPEPEEKCSPAAPLPWTDYHLSLIPLAAGLAHESLIFSHSWNEERVDEYVARVNKSMREMYPLVEEVIVLVQRAAACARLHVLEDETDDSASEERLVMLYEESLLRHLRPVGEMCWKSVNLKVDGRDMHGELAKRTIEAIEALIAKRRKVPAVGLRV